MISSKICRMGSAIINRHRSALMHGNAIEEPCRKTLLEPTTVNGLLYRLATTEDREMVREGLHKYFYPEDPVTTSHYLSSEATPDDTEGTLEMVDSGCMILAMDEETGRLAGFSGSALVQPKEAEKLRQKATKTLTKKYADILRLTAHLSEQTRVCERFGVDQAYHLDMVGVNPEFRGKAIGVILQKKHFELAHNKGLKVFSAYVTGPYSAMICERVGMQCVYTLPYSEYKDESGRVIFQGRKHFTEIKSFVMRM